MKKISKDDLKSKIQVVTGLNETVDGSQNNPERGLTEDGVERCIPDTFYSNCLCYTLGELGCVQSRNCPQTESGGDICCADTLDDVKTCVAETHDGCLAPTIESEDLACNDTEGC
ncbi:MAG: hypothetical protein J5523_05435 [Muribaculaceae bacterium]|nr:hypothetical protein [Muribaculaceae bacterium]